MRTMLAFVSAISLAGCVSSPTAYSPPAIAAESTSLQNVLGDANSVGASTGLTPADIAAIAVLSNPDLKALRARAGVADAQIFAAGLLPDPTVSLGVDIPTNGVGVVTALAGSIGADLSAASSRNARMEAARANARGMRQDILWAEWLTRQNAYLLANRISYLEQIRAKTSRLRQLANEDCHEYSRLPAGEMYLQSRSMPGVLALRMLQTGTGQRETSSRRRDLI